MPDREGPEGKDAPARSRRPGLRGSRRRRGAAAPPALLLAGTVALALGIDPAAVSPVHGQRPAATSRPAATGTGLVAVCPAPSLLAAVGGRRSLAHWSLDRLAAQTVVVPVDEHAVSSVRAEVLAGVGGVILFGSAAPTDLATQLRAVEAAAPGGVAPLVMADEEGGSVQRMANLVGEVPAARTMGETMGAPAIERLAARLGRRLLAAGVTMDLAPVLDVDGGAGPNATDADGTRSFSPEVPVAAADGTAFAAGLERSGVVPVVKHFPGLGGATGNTDLEPASTPAWLIEQRTGLVPFARAIAAHVPAVMVANASVPGLASGPASLSPAVVRGVLRGRLHFGGLVLTDSLSAASIRDAGYTVPRAAVAALRAGDDMVLFDPTSSTASLTSATVAAEAAAVRAGTLPRSRLVDAAAHVLAAKRCP